MLGKSVASSEGIHKKTSYLKLHEETNLILKRYLVLKLICHMFSVIYLVFFHIVRYEQKIPINQGHETQHLGSPRNNIKELVLSVLFIDGRTVFCCSSALLKLSLCHMTCKLCNTGWVNKIVVLYGREACFEITRNMLRN